MMTAPILGETTITIALDDKYAQDLLWEYARRMSFSDVKFCQSLQQSLQDAGYAPRDATLDQKLTTLCVAYSHAANDSNAFSASQFAMKKQEILDLVKEMSRTIVGLRRDAAVEVVD